jgi:uncharacterized protein YrrD
VVDPATGQIIDLVVHKRRLFNEDRVVPLGAVVRTDGGSLVLEQRFSAHNLSPFGGSRYKPHRYRSYGEGLMNVPVDTEGELVRETEGNIPAGTVAVKLGSPVLAADSVQVGRIHAMLTEPGSDRFSHLVVEHGLVDRLRRVIPAAMVETLAEHEVRLTASGEAVDTLPRYEPTGENMPPIDG